MNKRNIDDCDTVSKPKLTEQQKEICFKLRSMTGLGLLSCRKCLEEYNFDLEKAFNNNIKYQWNGVLKTQA